MWHSRNPS